MARVLTDFNDIDSTGTVSALLSHVEEPWNVVVGNRVLVYDDGEHEAWAKVTRIDDNMVFAELDWETWGPAGRYQVHAARDGVYVGMFYDTPFPLARGTAKIVTQLFSGPVDTPSIPSAPAAAVARSLVGGVPA